MAGGTWLAVNHNKEITCLLNGAFTKHVKSKIYRKSRGSVIIDSFDFRVVENFTQKYDFAGIEPFTLLLFRNGKLYVLRWDGYRTHLDQVDLKLPHIWSSTTLYDPVTIKERKKWFVQWIEKNISKPDRKIKDFHLSSYNNENQENNILMKRENGLQTVSITQVRTDGVIGTLEYIDLLNSKSTMTDLC